MGFGIRHRIIAFDQLDLRFWEAFANALDNLVTANHLAIADVKQIILKFVLQYRQHRPLGGILTVQDFGGAIRPSDFRRFTFYRRADHLLDSHFSGRFERHRRWAIKAANVTEANELKAVSFRISPAHELAASLSRGIDRRRV